MKKTTWAYIAGLLDGESTLRISKGNARHKDDKRAYVQYDVFIGISNTNVKIVNFLKDTCGGFIYHRPFSNDKWKDYRIWRLTGKKAQERFLLSVLPYLMIKRDQALLCLELVRMEPHSWQAAKREELYLKCRPLNAKGKSPEANTLTTSEQEVKIESELHGDMQKDAAVTLHA